jgi:hypothetical protein
MTLGEYSRALLDDPMFQETFRALRETLLADLADPSGDTAHREAAWHRYQALESVRKQLLDQRRRNK